MRIALDVSPITESNALARVRGVGSYTNLLKISLEKYFPEHSYTYFTRGQKISEDVDIIHIPYFSPYFMTLPIIKNKKKKIVVTVHDLIPLVFPQHFPSGFRGTAIWKIQKILLLNVDGVIVDSETSKKDLLRLTGISEKKLHVVYLAAGEVFGSPSAQKRKDVQKKFNLPDRFALYVGDVTWNKNVPRVLQAGREANVKLVVVGGAFVRNKLDSSNPWNKDLLFAQEEIKRRDDIIPVGYVENEELAAIYSLATVCIAPSLYEGFGLPVLEAMQSGCPVIVSREGSLPEVAGDAAFYVDAYKTESIVEAIKKMFGSQVQRKDFIEKGLKQASLFSWKKTAQETMGVYEKIR